MPRKWSIPYDGPPSWLSPRAERSLEDAPHYPTRAAFIGAAMGELLGGSLGLSVVQAANVTANALNESGNGRACGWNNPFGWKITRAYVESFKATHKDSDPPWWKAPGNIDSGDGAWCFYRSFESLGESLFEWVAHFVPPPGGEAPYPAYRRTGERFWAGDERWFGDLILVGYKGAISKLRMQALRSVGASDEEHPSVRAHRSLTRTALTVWAQLALDVDPDGAWGPKSSAACALWQRSRGLPASGDLDGVTLAALASISGTHTGHSPPA